MCGLVGFLQPGSFSTAAGEAQLRRQSDRLAHRGPDDAGLWVDAAQGIALGHRRLSIIDLSPAGHQPMASASGRYLIVFNGEIYNHADLRAELAAAGAAPAWRGHSDTETLLAGVDAWGIEPTLQRAAGMFAIALWDRETRSLLLARDRAGEKPLYYGWQGNTFLFGSELKALRAHASFRADIDRDALLDYMRLGYVPAPRSIYRGIFKLMPGTVLKVPAQGASGTLPEPVKYWSLKDAAERGLADPFAGTDVEATDALESELRRAVLEQSIADVPLGAFLSGGIDSTTVVALLQAQSSRRVKTFTIGFHESDYQEAQHAAAVARHLGTEHSELYVTPRETRDVIPSLPMMYDEPFGDSSAVPTHLVSRFARQHVTVCLSGDGGDELFGGYTRYRKTEETWRSLSRIPGFARRLLSLGCGAYARNSRTSASGWKARRLALYLSARTADECYAARILQFADADELMVGGQAHPGLRGFEASRGPALASGNLYDRMMYADAMTYLPDDILAKVDRAAMAVSLETRIPMLDHRVVELAWRLPLHMKVRGGVSKWLLRQVLYRHVPAALMERPKMGFGAPVGEWLRGPLREWAEDLLQESRLNREGFLNTRRVREQWTGHLNRSSNAGDALWQVLMFQSWLAASSAEPLAHAGQAA